MSAPFTGVVVGYDGSPHAEVALDWAIETAKRTDKELLVIHALPLESVPHFAPASPFGWMPAEGEDGVPVDTAGLRRAAEVLGRDKVHLARVVGNPAGRLVEASKHAWVTVTGTRGRGAVAAGVLGSTAYAVTAHSHSPVVVVRTRSGQEGAIHPGPDLPIVVGVDDTESAGSAIDTAAAIAAETGAAVRVVHSQQVAPVESWGFTPGATFEKEFEEAMTNHAERVTHEAADRIKAAHPEVAVEIAIRRGVPAHVLAKESEDAGLVVLGSRGRGGFAGLLLGSVSHSVIHGASCPVLVVR